MSLPRIDPTHHPSKTIPASNPMGEKGELDIKVRQMERTNPE
jgi:hypothetical protein